MRCAPRLFLLPALLLLSFSPAWAAEPMLFDTYAYGAPRAAMAALPNMKQGEGAFAGALLLDRVSFAGASWNARFEFNEDKLVRVSLMNAYTQDLADGVERHFRENGYEMLAILVGKRELDFVAMLKVGGIQGLEHALEQLHAEGPHPRITRAWFQTRGVSKDIKKMVKNLKEFLMAAPAETREAEVTVLTPSKEGETAMLLVDFSFPILDAHK